MARKKGRNKDHNNVKSTTSSSRPPEIPGASTANESTANSTTDCHNIITSEISSPSSEDPRCPSTSAILIDHCPLCTETLSKEGVWEHIKAHAYCCTECEFTTNKLRDISMHLSVVHGQTTNSEIPRSHFTFFCIVCNKKLLVQEEFNGPLFIQGVYNHYKTVHGVVRSREPGAFPCSVCDYVAARMGALIKHQRKEHLRCKICNELCCSKRDLFVHSKSNCRLKNYCAICDEHFDNHQLLQGHIKYAEGCGLHPPLLSNETQLNTTLNTIMTETTN